jgi:hypothetical protein
MSEDYNPIEHIGNCDTPGKDDYGMPLITREPIAPTKDAYGMPLVTPMTPEQEKAMLRVLPEERREQFEKFIAVLGLDLE